ncbi:MAG: SDR family oxidoreductase [Burkholderiales bacterium]|nr:SDR family oxidoreductase [Burkholderiales bacterium]
MTSASSAAGKIIFGARDHSVGRHANYAASEGVMMLVKTLAQELARHRIRVNSIAPGAIETPINATTRDTEAERRRLLELIPYGRIGEPIDIGRAAVWLASDASDYMTGATLYMDGGMLLYPGFIDNG